MTGSNHNTASRRVRRQRVDSDWWDLTHHSHSAITSLFHVTQAHCWNWP